MNILSKLAWGATLIIAVSCGGHSAGATEKTEPATQSPVETLTPEAGAAERIYGTRPSKGDIPEASHVIGTPKEELEKVIGDGSAKAELDFMELNVRKAEALDKNKASLMELREPVNNVSYSAQRLDRINQRTPLTAEEIERGKALMERINAIMSQRAPNVVTVGGQ